MEQLEISATGILSLFDTTKEQRSSFVNDLIEKVKDGTVNPLKVHCQIKAMEEIIKSVNDDPEYKSVVLDEAEKFGKKSFEFGNAKFQVKEVGVKYDFTMCGDPDWEQMNAQQESLKEKKKAKETELKALPAGGRSVVNESTGEVYKIFPPSKLSTTSVAVTLK